MPENETTPSYSLRLSEDAYMFIFERAKAGRRNMKTEMDIILDDYRDLLTLVKKADDKPK